MSTRVSAVIPAFNESPRLAGVLQPLLASRLVDEILVVDDGSTDQTATVVRGFDGVRLVSNRANLGKHPSVVRGARASSGDTLLLVDADIQNLTAEGIDSLVRPIIDDAADLTISYRSGQPFLFKFLIPYEPICSGERCLRTEDFWSIPRVETIKGFDFELLCNKFFLDANRRIGIVELPETASTLKIVKFPNPIDALLEDARVNWSLLRIAGASEITRQVLRISVPFQLGRIRRR